MKIQYDSKIDALYITLGKGKYKVTKKVSEDIMIDISTTGKIVGIEILDATKNITDFDPRPLSSLKVTL
ncbi:hypothetical protein A3D77_01295 [Candidatus Gottesmanbacteria bacterium RIFCSPHIGHO2_02_FULL_39_11]|uniref:DUF2283 domain-containing protein n=1 Tax=Candidatus Gottesmanbacteria bacterium RIFCSPHIGHO2_02_FULL_39_11 TaxID=1798382 RepID=A0A1F5ZTJ2_9BACT|nr:MAG: hypothetical protein A3D77_01295 [Candidatus Gottesmanbacteria bacterium RIFCSPHIGHO2_02_FULL_39_11]